MLDMKKQRLTTDFVRNNTNENIFLNNFNTLKGEKKNLPTYNCIIEKHISQYRASLVA